MRGNREQPRPGGGWSKIGTVGRPDRQESRRKRPFRLNRADRLLTIAARGSIDGKCRNQAKRGGGRRGFYDSFWPAHVPDVGKAREHTLKYIPDRAFSRALDAGCGSGVSSIAPLDRSKAVVSMDISRGSLDGARKLARAARADIDFVNGSLMDIPFGDESFDLVYCYGVVSFTSKPYRALEELLRVLATGGVLVLAVYERTALSSVHNVLQRGIHVIPGGARTAVIKLLAAAIVLVAKFTGRASQDYGLSVEAKVRDFYLTPRKYFFNLGELREIFDDAGVQFEVAARETGRFKSASNVVAVGVRQPSPPRK